MSARLQISTVEGMFLFLLFLSRANGDSANTQMKVIKKGITPFMRGLGKGL
jgi:hypothetical protein